jgi:uncharacterized protein YkwD
LNKYGTVGGGLSENIGYGSSTALRTILQFIVDDGVANRGHRNTIFSTDFNYLGVAFCQHPTYGFETVIPYAVEIADLQVTKDKRTNQAGGLPDNWKENP